MQLDRPDRGFSFSKEGPLDMRMDQSSGVSASEIVNEWSEEELGILFRNYGEEKQWRRAARAVVEARGQKRIETTSELREILYQALTKKRNIHPATLVFQALRIEVNNELKQLEEVLPVAIECLAPGGVLGIMSFHSLEDRMVKRAFQKAASDKVDTSGRAGVFQDKDPIVKLITRKAIKPTEEEIAENPRSRSTRLRIVEKI